MIWQGDKGMALSGGSKIMQDTGNQKQFGMGGADDRYRNSGRRG